jgi:hypothetical protein
MAKNQYDAGIYAHSGIILTIRFILQENAGESLSLHTTAFVYINIILLPTTLFNDKTLECIDHAYKVH